MRTKTEQLYKQIRNLQDYVFTSKDPQLLQLIDELEYAFREFEVAEYKSIRIRKDDRRGHP